MCASVPPGIRTRWGASSERASRRPDRLPRRKHSPEEGEFVTDAIVILKTIDPEGRVGLRMEYSDGMSWLERIGMLRATEILERPDPRDWSEAGD